jgi:hypothetical protein
MEDRCLLSTLTVTSARDSGAGSLRQAIRDAHSGDTIGFDKSLRDQIVTLTGGDLVIDKDLEIDGLGEGVMAVSGESSGRVFHVTVGARVTIKDLAVINGRASLGGGILNEGGRLTLEGVLLQGNQAVGDGVVDGQVAPGRGGAVASVGAGATLTVSTSDFVYNSATGARGLDGGSGFYVGAGGEGLGGGIYSDAGTTVTVRGCTFGGDKAVGGAGGDGGRGSLTGFGGQGQGGGIAVVGAGAALTIKDSRFIDLVARGGDGGRGRGEVNGPGGTAFGGAVFMLSSDGTLRVEGTTFIRNQALGGAGRSGEIDVPLGESGTGGGASAGALYSSGSTVTVTRSSFQRNQAIGATATPVPIPPELAVAAATHSAAPS